MNDILTVHEMTCPCGWKITNCPMCHGKLTNPVTMPHPSHLVLWCGQCAEDHNG